MFFLYNLDVISPFFVLVFLFFKKTKIEGAFLWFILFIGALFFFTFIAFLIQEIPILLGKKPGKNLLAYHLGCIAYTIILYNFFSKVLVYKYSRWVDIVFLIPFTLLSIYNFIYLRRTFTIYGLTSIWIVIKCLSYFSQEIANPTHEDILQKRLFWIVSGLFLYFSVAFFIFITYDFLTVGILSGHFAFSVGIFWFVQNMILVLSCGFYIKAISCKE